MRYAPISPSLFIEHRQQFSSLMKPRSLAVFHSNDIMPQNADGVYPFCQNTDLFYLTGIDQEETILIIYPDAVEEKYREVLFITENSDNITLWQGNRLTIDQASQISGINNVHYVRQFSMLFKQLAILTDHIYLNTNEHLRADTMVETRDRRFINHCRFQFPLHAYERSAPIMQNLRAVKSEIEIQLIQQAIDITQSAFYRLLKAVKPGIWEYELEAEIFYEMIRRGSRGPAFSPVVASGKNTCVLHYVNNDQRLQSKTLVLIDFGAEYANYAADVTRTLPVSGRFSKRQRAVYQAVRQVQLTAIDLLRPGITLSEYHRQVGLAMEIALLNLKLLKIKDIQSQDPAKPLYKKYFPHGTSHHLGLDVHDTADIYRPFEKGMVLSCEPGIYIPEENIGIRLENDILITDDKPIDLTASIPIEADEIEVLMNEAK